MKAKMGGQGAVRVFLKGGEDLSRALLADPAGPPRLRDGPRARLAGMGAGAALELRQEACGRSDLLLQELGGPPAPEELAREGLAEDPAAGVAPSRLWQSGCDVAVFSLYPEVAHPLWRHRASGRLVYAPPAWERAAPPARRAWFAAAFEPAGLLPVEGFKENFARLVRAVHDRLGAHVLVLNCSSLDPEDDVHNYHGREDTVALRIHRFNLALMQLSAREGISIIDAERLISELGGERHVEGVCRYSAEACEAVGEEFLRVLQDIGFFERRPLILQAGQRGR